MSEHHHDRRKNDQEAKLTHAFMHSVLGALRVIIHKLDLILERLPEEHKPTKMTLKFGQAEDK
jgi:hypothetical protein